MSKTHEKIRNEEITQIDLGLFIGVHPDKLEMLRLTNLIIKDMHRRTLVMIDRIETLGEHVALLETNLYPPMSPDDKPIEVDEKLLPFNKDGEKNDEIHKS